MSLNLTRRLEKGLPLTAEDHDSNLDKLEVAIEDRVTGADLQSGLNAIGPFSRNGGISTVGVQLQEVSNNSALLASTGISESDTVPTQYAVKAYLDANYSKVFKYEQATPSTTWTINHNLNFTPSVEVFNSGSQEIDADVVHLSVNQTVINFTVPTSGFARLN